MRRPRLSWPPRCAAEASQGAAAGVELYVDVDALGELSRQLQAVKTALEDASEEVGGYGGRLGSERLAEALEGFVGGWRDGRRKIIGAIDSQQGRMQGAADTYREQEEQLSQAAGAGR